MGIDSYKGSYPDDLDVSDSLIDKHGVKACRAAETLEEGSLNEGTLTTYKPQVRQVISEFDTEFPDPEKVVDFIDSTDKSGSTKNIMVVAMKNYYKYNNEPDKEEKLDAVAKKEGVAQTDFNQDMGIKGWLTEDEVNTIIDHLLPKDGENIREIDFGQKTWIFNIEYKALFCCLYYTGCRVSEVLLLEVGDLYPDEEQMKLYRLKKKGKGVKRDMKVVPSNLIDILQDYIEYADVEDGKIFKFSPKTAQNRMADIDRAYKHAFGEFQHAEKLTPHKLRHARVTAIANNASLEEAGQYVEHSSPEVTNSYRHISTEEQRDILPENSKDDAVEKLMKKLDVDNPEEAIEKIDELT